VVGRVIPLFFSPLLSLSCSHFPVLGIDNIALVLQQNRLHRYGHVLCKEDYDWVKKCMEYEVEGPRPRGRPKRTC